MILNATQFQDNIVIFNDHAEYQFPQTQCRSTPATTAGIVHYLP